MSFVDYADAGDYVLNFTVTAKANQRGQVLARVCLFFSGQLAVHFKMVIMINRLVGGVDQVSQCCGSDPTFQVYEPRGLGPIWQPVLTEGVRLLGCIWVGLCKHNSVGDVCVSTFSMPERKITFVGYHRWF